MTGPVAHAASGQDHRLPWLYRWVLAIDTAPLVRQLPAMFAAGLALTLCLAIPQIGMTLPSVAWTGIAIVAGASSLSWVFSLNATRPSATLIVPVATMLGLGIFRVGTGGPLSVYTATIFLPIIWIAAEEGRRHIALAFVTACVTMAMPYILEMRLPMNAAEWTLCIFTPMVAGLAAAYINELSRQAHEQIRVAQRVAAERSALLAEARQGARRAREREAQLRIANALTSSVLNSVTEQAIIGTDSSGLIDVWNPGASALLGLTPGETRGARHIDDFYLAEEIAQRAAELTQEAEAAGTTVPRDAFGVLVSAVRPGEADVHTWTYQKANGQRVPVEVAVTARTDATGEAIGYIFVASDVSDALKIARLKDEFIGLISHELRTPLSSVVGYLELLRDEGVALTASQEHYLDVIEHNAERLLHLVRDVLVTAQMDSGTFPIDTAHTDLGVIVAGAVESARPAASTAGIQLELELPRAEVEAEVDQDRLGQALDNLIANAIKFTPRDGRVEVRLEATRRHATIYVSDTGVGIPAGEIERLGSKFFRATTATRRAIPGTGLGLSIAKSIIEAHGGRLGATSTEGIGTTFTVTLPYVALSARRSPDPPPSLRPPASASR